MVLGSVCHAQVERLVLTSGRLQGHDVPVDAHPMLIEREDTSRTNYSQMLPYESREKTKHMKLYNNLNRIFARVFEWISVQVSIRMVSV